MKQQLLDTYVKGIKTITENILRIEMLFAPLFFFSSLVYSSETS